MWLIKRVTLLISLGLTACTPPIFVEMAVLPAVPATAKIKQLNSNAGNQISSTCSVPFNVTVEGDSNYEVRLDAPGYYPVVVQLDWGMAFSTAQDIADAFDTKKNRTPLVIPLIQRKLIKDNPVNGYSGKPTQ